VYLVEIMKIPRGLKVGLKRASKLLDCASVGVSSENPRNSHLGRDLAYGLCIALRTWGRRGIC
jgi:hypothetical protein